MPVSDRLDYSLRPNKNVERKLMIEVLRALMPEFTIPEYRYVGMGSLWFVDFGLVHRTLGIYDMVSIERDTPDRAVFNRPFKCIEVKDGDTTSVLPTLRLKRKPSVVWLDHESGIDGPGLRDATLVSERVPSGSVLVLTLNAQAQRLKNQKDPDGNDLTKEEYLRMKAGDAVPFPLSKDALDKDRYPALLGRIVSAHIRHSLRAAGRPEKFWQFFDLAYQDGAPMVTVGGMIATEEEAAKIAWDRLSPLEGCVRDGEPQASIAVPLLTAREKVALDRLLPCDGALTEEVVRENYEFTISQEKLDAYRTFYRYYPLFAEYLP
jgi:hypothetical protein